LYEYIEEIYGQPSLLKNEDDILEEAHPSSTYHETLFHNISELEEDEEWMPHVENEKEMCDVIKKEDLVEERPQEEPYYSLEYDEAIEDFVASPQEENNDEEYSHASIGNQDTFERQIYEENIDDISIQASITYLLHESKGLICYNHFQYFEFYDTSFSNLEKENLMEKPLFDEKHDKT
jgi:hypothetical protein